MSADPSRSRASTLRSVTFGRDTRVRHFGRGLLGPALGDALACRCGDPWTWAAALSTSLSYQHFTALPTAWPTVFNARTV